jgi:inorganic pyrophosphatase
MTMMDGGIPDHKVVAVATKDPEFSGYHQVNEIPPHKLAIIRRFFQDYKQLEKKSVTVDEIQPAEHAYSVIKSSLEAYERKFK